MQVDLNVTGVGREYDSEVTIGSAPILVNGDLTWEIWVAIWISTFNLNCFLKTHLWDGQDLAWVKIAVMEFNHVWAASNIIVLIILMGAHL